MQKTLRNVLQFFALAVMLLGANMTWGQATLPVTRTTWNGSVPTGWTDAAGTPYLSTFACTGSNGAKFEASTDYYIVNFNGVPDKLSFTFKSNNSTTTSSLLVEQSTDGNTYTTVINLSGTSALPSSCTDKGPYTLNAATRYVRWKFTKGTSNGTMDDVSITAAAGNTVTFDKNATDATGTMANQTASTATNLTNNAFSRTGYSFSGWATTASGAVAYANGASYPFTASATLYAVWAALPNAPALTAAATATVDAPFNVTFTDNATWRGAITGITVGGTTLPTGAYTVSAGQITFTPSASTLLQSAGTKSIVVSATGYNTATVSQVIGAGAANKLAIGTQPTAPASNGAVLATQPVVNIVDQYGNATTSNANVVATVGAGSWTIGGTTTRAGVSGTATFTNLTATAATAVSGATITFTSTGLASVTSSAFNIPSPPAPALTAAANATVDAPFIVTFTDNATWRSAITSITVGGTALPTTGAYSVTAGQITFTPSGSSLLQSAGSKSIVVNATGFAAATVTQVIGAGAANKLAITTQPSAPSTNGNTLNTQPVVVIRDQYNNATTSTAPVTAAVGAGTWTIGGTLTQNGVTGTVTYTNLTATSATGVSGARITFTSPGLTSVTSGTFTIPVPAPVNDNCTGAIALVLGAAPVTGDVTGATQSIAPINCTTTSDDADDDVWYSFTTTTAGIYTVFVSGSSSFDAILDLRTGSCNGTNIACADSGIMGETETISQSLSANTTYYVRVYDYSTGTPSTPTFTISVSAAPPVATAATNINTSGFTANWNAVANASGYRLDVATANVFNNIVLSEDFSYFTSSSPSTHVGNNQSYFHTSGWSGTNVFDANTGYPRLGTGNNPGILTTPTINLSSNNGNHTVTVDIKKYNNDSSTNTVQVMYSANGGSTWTQLGSNVSPPVNFTTFTFNITGGTANSQIRIQNTGGNQRFHIDNLSIGFTNILPAYNNLAVSGTSQVVTGLAEATTYYYRVRAINPAGTSDNSNTISVRTAGNLIWNGTQWLAGSTVVTTPTTADNGTVNAAYTTPAAGLNIGNLTVSPTGSVNIPSNTTMTVAGTFTNNAGTGNFTVQNNGALVQTATGVATNTGGITVYKTSNPLYRLDYKLWSAPTTGQTLRVFSMGTSNNRFYEYVSSSTQDEGYYPVDPLTTSFTTANRGKSFLIRMPNSIAGNIAGSTHDLTTTPAEYAAGTDDIYLNSTFEGVANTGDITYALNTTGGRFNAVGNPYPSPINIAQFLSANSSQLDSGTLYFWRKRNSATVDTGSYATLTLADFQPNASGDNGTNNTGGQENETYYVNGNSNNWTIAPGQGFIVKAAAGATNLNFSNAIRKAAPTTGSQANLKAGVSQVSRFRVKMSAANTEASLMSVVYMPEATMGLDFGYDGKKLVEGSVALYSLVQDNMLAIQARPEFDAADVVPVGFKAVEAGSFKLSLAYTDGIFANGQKIYVKDKAEGIIRDITEADYTFTSDAGTIDDRFEIIYTTQALGTDTPVLDANTIIVYQNDNAINVNSGSALISSINVFDIRGRKLYTAEKVNATEAVINNLTAAKQVLIVEITTNKGKVSKKIVF